MKCRKKDSFLIYGNDQYFRAVIRLGRAMDYMHENDQVNARKTMNMAQGCHSEYENGAGKLQKFRTYRD
ncbi:hypothetical protein AU504_04725 [Lonsdalea populi]|nr:hypothetical protein AU508_07225 [Lonsdalea populi]RAT70523.1 hypothetical protein AU505_11130 [Lonsdalea populi]RAT71753.1 hypothetical protein AU504_04725 [Lonsdalea populi]RAT75093.1 hypothetical protein AU506_10835 [Lonsdalea populi]RAT79378.1 hypothetical protein AU507_03925 [Lonsdalea populi]